MGTLRHMTIVALSFPACVQFFTGSAKGTAFGEFHQQKIKAILQNEQSLSIENNKYTTPTFQQYQILHFKY